MPDQRTDEVRRMDMEERLRKTETAVARIEEQTKTIFHWMETHSDEEKSRWTKWDKMMDTMENKIDELEAYSHNRNQEILSEIQKVDAKRITALDSLSTKIDKIDSQQDDLIAMKNKWGGIILALSFVGGVALTLSGSLMGWIQSVFAGS